jgi:hypothetical protein
MVSIWSTKSIKHSLEQSVMILKQLLELKPRQQIKQILKRTAS